MQGYDDNSAPNSTTTMPAESSQQVVNPFSLYAQAD
jgi:hypothetical protein